MNKSVLKFAVLAIIFTMALSVNYLFAAWTGPTQAPPAGNTPTPIHVGLTTQTKDGGFLAGGLRSFGDLYVDGNVGIGTVNPVTALEISSTSGGGENLAPRLRLTVTNAGEGIHAPGIEFMNPDTSSTKVSKLISRDGTAFSFEHDEPLLWPAGGGSDPLVTIKTTGNVGIGTTNPSQKLDVAGNIQASGTVCDSNGCIGSGGGGGGGHADGANCPAGEVPLGVDANGNAQGCYIPAGGGTPSCFKKDGGTGSTPRSATCPAGSYVMSGYCSGTNEHVTNINPDTRSITCTADTKESDGSIHGSNVHPYAICCQ